MKKQLAQTYCSALILTLFLALGNSAFSQTYSSTASGNWGSGSTWLGGSVPVSGNSVGIGGGNTVTCGSGDSYAGGYAWWNGLGVGINFGPNVGAGTLNITGGTLDTGGFFVGHDYAGTINLSGGTLNASGQHMLFGWTAGSTLNVSGGTLNMTGSGNLWNIGHGAASAINVTGSGVANFSGGISLMNGSSINANGGTVNINNATLDVAAGTLLQAQAGGSINLVAGTQVIGNGNTLWVGANGTTGNLNISGGTWQQNGYVRMGVFASGNGVVNQTGGTFEIANNFEAWGSSPSAYNLQGGTFRVAASGVQMNNYSGGTMQFNITGASGNVTMDMPYDFTVNNSSVFNNPSATLTKSGAGTLIFANAGQLDIRNGALAMQAGTIETASSMVIGSSGGTASGTNSGGTLKVGYLGAANFIVGYGATGTLTQSSGAVDVGSQASAVFGWDPGSIGTYTLSGGTFSASGNNTYLGLFGGTGTVNVNGGSLTASNLYVGGNGAASGTLNLNGGTFGVNGSFTVGSAGTVNINSGGALSGGSGNNVTVGNNGLVKFNGGTGNAGMNFFVGGGGTVDVNGKSLANGNWANLIASSPGAVLKNSSATAAVITNGNTIWLWDGGQNLTIDASGGNIQIDSWITSSGQATPTGIIKTGTNNLTLTYAGNDYTGTTAINAGRVVLTDGHALGSTAGGTIVASGAQLRLNPTSGGLTIGNEALTISGDGLTGSAGGALRSAAGANTYQGNITLAANATIGAASGTSLTMDVTSGDAIDLSSYTLTFDGAGTNQVNDSITGTGGLTKIGSGRTILNAANTYSGNTTITLGTLALSGSGSIANSANVSIASGATLDLTGLSGVCSLNGNLTTGPGALKVAYAGTPAISAGGTVTLASGTTLTVNNTGAQLTHGSHKLIAKTGGGSVTGTLPTSYSVTGGGAASPNYLWLSGGELYLAVNNAPVAQALTVGAPAGATSSIVIIDGKPGMAPTDADGDAMLVSQVQNPSALLGATVSTDGTNIFYTPGLNASGADTVQYVVRDGFGGYDTNTMYVSVSNQSLNIVSGPTLVSNQFQVGFAGIPGYTYAVDDSTTSASGPWVFYTNLTAGASGLFQLVATNDPPAPMRFFRTRPAP